MENVTISNFTPIVILTNNSPLYGISKSESHPRTLCRSDLCDFILTVEVCLYISRFSFYEGSSKIPQKRSMEHRQGVPARGGGSVGASPPVAPDGGGGSPRVAEC